LGLRLEVNRTLTSLILHLPNTVDESSFVDLAPLVLDDRVNDLIFGTDVKADNGVIRYPGAGFNEQDVVETVVPIRSFGSESGYDPLYRIELASKIRGTKGRPIHVYLRFRVRIPDPKYIWHRKGWAFAKRGAIFDLRVSDVREGLPHGTQPPIAVKFKPVQRFFGFLIVPVTYHPGTFSPQLHYSRLLEGQVWQPYLAGCEFNPTEKLTIHQWRSPPNDAVDYRQPFRIYMHLHREFGWAIFIAYFLGGLSAPIVVALASRGARDLLDFEWCSP
jgi:hypothetical protein